MEREAPLGADRWAVENWAVGSSWEGKKEQPWDRMEDTVQEDLHQDNNLAVGGRKYTKDHSDKQGSICMELNGPLREEGDYPNLRASGLRP